MIVTEEICVKLRNKFISEFNKSADRFEKSTSDVKIINFSAYIVKITLESGGNVQ